MNAQLAITASVGLLMGCGSDPAMTGSDAGSSPTPDSGLSPDSGSPGLSDAGPGESDAGPGESDAGSGGSDADVPTGGATLVGTITRSAAPAAGGVGHLYIAVFDIDPVMNRDTAMLIANSRVENADMSAADASVTYSVPGIPPRAEPYFVTAFLDDNMSVVATDASSAGPDRGDLVAIMGFGSPSVAATSATEVAFDIDLNFNLPF